MNILHTIILAVIEGITEFLPVSSTGHMILASKILGIVQTDFVKSFEIIIQLGAILAVLAISGKKLLKDKAILIRVGAAFIPTAIIGFILYKFVKHMLLGNSIITVIALLLGALVMIAVEQWIKTHPGKQTIQTMSLFQAVVIGAVQALAVIPGVSRSAATIVASLLFGISREESVEFSFLLAFPTIFAATALDIVKEPPAVHGGEIGLLLLGLVVSFFTALVVIRWFIGYTKKYTLLPFAIYRIIVALLFFITIR